MADQHHHLRSTGPNGNHRLHELVRHPDAFRGDQIATMEAKYADGSPAGPANWTPFKEFLQHFQPDYTAETIILKPDFFAEVNDGVVILTFHFWSGTQVTYRLTKSGNSVTGGTG